VAWHIRGSYFETCNCDAICPCRHVNGAPGGRSTSGICMGVLSWLIEDGQADGVELAGIPVGIACRYSDDVEGSPWDWILYLDATASAAQRTALEGIFTGHLGGDALEHFPWARKPSDLLAVQAVGLEVHHEPRRQRFRVHDHVTVRIRERYSGTETVTCGIPGHHREGEELIADVMRVDDGPLVFEYSGNCGYAATFDYSG
jgi:hypothetical protein